LVGKGLVDALGAGEGVVEGAGEESFDGVLVETG